jgi:hypothetical protein
LELKWLGGRGPPHWSGVENGTKRLILPFEKREYEEILSSLQEVEMTFLTRP